MPSNIIDGQSAADTEKNIQDGERSSSSTSATSGRNHIKSEYPDANPASGKDEEKEIEAPNGSGGVLEKVLSKVQSRSSYIDPGPPPDCGLAAWTQAFMTHLIVFNTWGYINSFGVFQTYYVTTLKHPPSDVSWVGSIHMFLLFFIGTFSGRGAYFSERSFLFGVVF